MTQEVMASPVVRAAQDLTEIERLSDELEAEAINAASDPMMPGGRAMVTLAGAANLEAWENLQQATERYGRAYTSADDEDPDEAWSAFQLLLFWSEQWRVELDHETEVRPTLASEVKFLRWCLNWAWANELNWDDFATDVRRARARLEDLLREGLRSERGVPCLSCNVDLVRPTANRREVNWCSGHDGVCKIPHERCPHDRGGLRDVWVCPSCEREYDTESYRRAVAQAHLFSADWLTVEQVTTRTGVARGSITGWASRGQVRRRKDVQTGRMTYSVTDVETRMAEEVAS